MYRRDVPLIQLLVAFVIGVLFTIVISVALVRKTMHSLPVHTASTRMITEQHCIDLLAEEQP
jgi:hypothetical protein